MTDTTAVATPPKPITAGSTDELYDRSYVDIDEQRDEPVPHRYVHGGFEGTDARFSFYFPLQDQYRGRFFHNTYPMATSENVGPFPIEFDVATGNLGFTFASGAYYVQTNLGGTDRMAHADVTIGGYRVNAVAARYSRAVAARVYGEHRPWGYLFGGSGGAYQVMGAAENTVGIWDGFVPFVLGVPYCVPSTFTTRLHALRTLKRRNRFPGIMDAINPGGSGDPYAGLDAEEAAAFREASLFGIPPGAWYDWETMTGGYLQYTVAQIARLDPTYPDDFWSKPGYAGADPASPLRDLRVQFETTVARVVPGEVNRIELAAIPDQDFAAADLVLLSGDQAGESLLLGPEGGNPLRFARSADVAVINRIKAGDRVRIDNSWALALETYHRHQLPPTPDFEGWKQFRGADGEPLYPQRDVHVGRFLAIATAGALPTGRVRGKTLALECLLDLDGIPWMADWYRAAAKRQLGADFEDLFALYLIEHAQHDNPTTKQGLAHSIPFDGALQQALRDLAAWVEDGVRPSETRYRMVDTQVVVPADAAERGGIQATVDLTVDGGRRAQAEVGAPVAFTARVDVPPGAGKVVGAEWDFEGTGDFAVSDPIERPQEHVALQATHAYAAAGTYYPVVRVASQRDGDPHTPYARVHNIGRARVVVA